MRSCNSCFFIILVMGLYFLINITNKFELDAGQRASFYDYSRITRNGGESELYENDQQLKRNYEFELLCLN